MTTHDAQGAPSITYTVDSFQNGIAFGQHRLPAGEDPRDHYHLRLQDADDLVQLRSRYVLHKERPLAELERHLTRLSQQGILGSAVIYFGTTTDPFFPFDGKFDASMKFLELFKRFLPGLLVVQTRSPLLVIAMPVLRALGKRAVVTMGVETYCDDAVARYTPGFPAVQDRLKAASALRRFGVEVTLQVNPVLPYGDWRKDAPEFAGILAEHADFVHVRPLSDGSPRRERRVRKMPVAQRLAQDRKFHWLRPDSATPLITALEKVAPEKLVVPERDALLQRQLSIFVA